MGWFLIPKPEEKLSWGMYDAPSRKRDHAYEMQVTGKARVHGVEGVEITAREAPYTGKPDTIERTFVAQLTDTHCRYLAALRLEGDIRDYITFLDADEFMPVWGFGEDNCGWVTELSRKGCIRRDGATVTSDARDFLMDVVGRYTVSIGDKTFDTVCLMSIESPGCAAITEQYLDASGKTVLWRRFNRDDWIIGPDERPWSQQLPENDRLLVNGTTYVHWYDCITDHVL